MCVCIHWQSQLKILNAKILQEKEDKGGDEEEPSANIVPKWKAGQVTAIHLQSEEEEEQDKQEETSSQGQYRGQGHWSKII